MANEVLEQVKQLLEGSVDAAVILDADRRILYYNRAYEVLSGMRGRQLAQRVDAGVHCWEIFPLEICENACLGCKARENARALRVDEIKAIRDKDGDELTFIVAAVPMGDGVVIETYRDVTADVRIQRRLKVLLDRERRAKEILEEEVRERTKELRQAQAQLVHQEKMSSLGRLVAGIAHELNNPINFVYGNVDFLGQYMEDLLELVRLIDEARLPQELRDQLAQKKEEIEYEFLVEDSRKLIRSIRSGAERTAGIVQDLKSFSRTRSSELQEADVAAGIETTLNLIAPLLKNRVTVERQITPNLPRLVCNAGHINQVFMNILTNAAQAIEGEGVIRVEIDTTEDDGAIQVVISDSGPGIDPEIAEKITDPFFTTKDVGEGTGLGLWISENIVRAHGGRLECASKPGQGATFIVTLPVRAPETARARHRRARLGPRPGPPASIPWRASMATDGAQSRPRLLIVDDEPLNRELLRRVLQRDYDIAEAEDAEGALEILEREDGVQLVLCDQLMPGRSGTELAAEVRERWSSIIFLLLTGYDDDPAVTAARDSGLVREVIAKPWRGSSLKGRIRHALDGGGDG